MLEILYTLVMLVVMLLVVYAVLGGYLKLQNHQACYGDVVELLRQTARAIPDGRGRVYAHEGLGVAVVVLPAHNGRHHPFDMFSILDLGQVHESQMPSYEDPAYAKSLAYRVQKHMVYRDPAVPLESSSLLAVWWVLTKRIWKLRGRVVKVLLNLGLVAEVCPERAELEWVAEVVRTADRSWAGPLPCALNALA